MFTRGIVSTQRVEGIHRWAKEGRLTKRKKLNDVFDALMVIVGELILKWERLDTRVTTGSFRSRHERRAPKPHSKLVSPNPNKTQTRFYAHMGP